MPPSEQRPPPKVTPVPIPVPFGLQQPPKPAPAWAAPKLVPSFAGTGQQTGADQSSPATLKSKPPFARENENAKKVPDRPALEMKRAGSSQNPLPPRHAPPRSPERPEEADPPFVMGDMIFTPIPIPRPAGLTPAKAGVRPPPEPNSAASTPRSSAKKTDEERRKAISAAMKARWASGSMDHVPAKRVETLRRLKEEQTTVVSLLPAKDAEGARDGGLSKQTSSHHTAKRNRTRSDLTSPSSSTDLARSHRSTAPGLHADSTEVDSDLTDSDVEMMDNDTDSGTDSDSDESTERAANIYSFASLAAISTEDWSPLWSYLQPFLTEHKGPNPPDKDHVKELIVLPKARDLEWRPAYIRQAPFIDSQPRDVSALILQATGEPAPEPCSCCAEAKGPFANCVMISRRAHENALHNLFSCGNCVYRGLQGDCTHEIWGMQRAEVISNARAGHGNPRLLANVLDSRASRLASDDSSALEFTGDSDGDRKDKSPSSIPASTNMAEPGRPYTMWPDDDGNLASMCGALVPKGYQLEHSIPGLQWICAIRSCRRLFQSRKNLGRHFNSLHFGCLLNDNGDGTLTVTGSYKTSNQVPGGGGKISTRAPPLVTSRDTISTDEPMPAPSLPSSSANSDLGRSRSTLDSSRDKENVRYPKRQSTGGPHNMARPSMSATPTCTKTAEDEKMNGGAEFWEYMRPFLHSTALPPDTGFVKELLKLPRLRDLILNPSVPTIHFREKTARDIAAMIIQLSGEALETCSRCVAGKGPFSGCYAISRKSDGYARGRYIGCANCVYQGNQSQCTIKNLVLRRSQSPIPKFTGKVVTQKGLALAESSTRLRRDGTDEDGDMESSLSGGLEEPPSKRLRTRQSTTSLAMARSPNPTTPAGPSSALITAGQLQPPQILEMEDWEIAPGRVREAVSEANGDDPDNVAFSKAYLSANHAVPVCHDVAFRVDTVTSGATLYIEADPSKTRICSLATGKLLVRIKGEQEQEFTIGPHGMFRVKAGVSCSVTNRLYIDSILHTTLLSGYI